MPNGAADLPSVDDTPKTFSGRTAESRFQEIHDAFAGQLLRFLIRQTNGDPEWAKDILQETFLRAWREIDNLPESPHRVRSWLYTVAYNVLIDAVRARQARPSEVTTIDITRVASPEDMMERVVNSQSLLKAMRRLSPAHQAVLVEIYFYGSSTAQAAKQLGIPPGTVKSRCFHAVRALYDAVRSVGLTEGLRHGR